MSTSTDAILGFGWCGKEEASLYSSDEDKNAVHDAVLQRIEKKFGVVVDSHCCTDEPMIYFAVRSSITIAHRGYPERVRFPRPADLVSDAWSENLKAALRHLWETQPSLARQLLLPKPARARFSWFLCSNWS